MKKLALHWQIIIAMIAGVLFGLLAKLSYRLNLKHFRK